MKRYSKKGNLNEIKITNYTEEAVKVSIHLKMQQFSAGLSYTLYLYAISQKQSKVLSLS
jgi:hypothetical protein